MKWWSTFKEAQALFTENHWMTEHTMKLYIHLIKLTFPNNINIGLILDKASMHDCKGLSEHVKTNNNMPPFIHIGFVTENLTSAYSPPDIVVIKDLKANIRRKYDHLLSSKRKKRGERVNITREDVVSMVTSSFEDVNTINEKDQRIRRGFDMCGLNPYSEDTKMFERHLDSLSENKMHKALIDKNFERDID